MKGRIRLLVGGLSIRLGLGCPDVELRLRYIVVAIVVALIVPLVLLLPGPLPNSLSAEAPEAHGARDERRGRACGRDGDVD